MCECRMPNKQVGIWKPILAGVVAGCAAGLAFSLFEELKPEAVAISRNMLKRVKEKYVNEMPNPIKIFKDELKDTFRKPSEEA